MKNLFVPNLKLGVRLCELVQSAIRIHKLSQTLSHTHTNTLDVKYELLKYMHANGKDIEMMMIRSDKERW